MPYLINDEWFATKDAVKDRCREILARTPDSTLVSDADSDFLYELFQHHEEWTEKAGEGVKCIAELASRRLCVSVILQMPHLLLPFIQKLLPVVCVWPFCYTR